MRGQRWWSDWRVAAGFVAGAGASWLGGLAGGTSVLIGLGIAGGVLLVTWAELEVEPGWERPRTVRSHGVRGDIQDLTWSMVGRHGRVGERALRTLRDVAAGRLARHGLVLGSADDDEAVRSLVGPRAHATLTSTSSWPPSLQDVRHTVDVLDRLGPHRDTAQPAARGPRPDPGPDQPAADSPARRPHR